MGAGAGDSVSILLSPPCNARLANLCGAMDGNIAHIAGAFEVSIRRRGGRFNLRGKAAQEAADALQKLYARAERGIDLADVQLCMAAPETAPARFPKTPHAGGGFAPQNASQEILMQKILQHSITFCAGPAGTGKTHTALAAALHFFCGGQSGGRLVLTRPAVEAGGERIGFLPGDMEQKVNPYLRPLHDILYRLLGRREAERRMGEGRIEVLPLSFMRGLTIDGAVVVLDEAQNTTPAQLKMALTRLGAGGRMIITGDESQSDLPSGIVSGLSDAVRRLAKIPGIAFHRFDEGDIVRHPLVRDILRAYRANPKNGATESAPEKFMPKESAAKESAMKESPKESPAKKLTAQKTAAKESAAKKLTAKKSVVKKSAAKESAAVKMAAKMAAGELSQ